MKPIGILNEDSKVIEFVFFLVRNTKKICIAIVSACVTSYMFLLVGFFFFLAFK